jgi:hypothetical protein
MFRSFPSAKVVVRIDSAAGVMTAAPLQGPCGDQRRLAPGKTREQRGDGEEDEAGDEHPSPSK